MVFLEITPFDKIGEGMMKLFRDKQNDTDVRENKITSRTTPRDISLTPEEISSFVDT